MTKYFYDVKQGDVLSFEKECLVSFKTGIAGGKFIFKCETDSRDYDTKYRLKIKETHTRLVGKNPYFIQAWRIN